MRGRFTFSSLLTGKSFSTSTCISSILRYHDFQFPPHREIVFNLLRRRLRISGKPFSSLLTGKSFSTPRRQFVSVGDWLSVPSSQGNRFQRKLGNSSAHIRYFQFPPHREIVFNSPFPLGDALVQPLSVPSSQGNRFQHKSDQQNKESRLPFQFPPHREIVFN